VSRGEEARAGSAGRFGPAARAICGMALLATLALAASGCADEAPAELRARRAAKARGDILIGAGGPWSTPDGAALWAGMELATEEVRAAGGLLGRGLRLVRGDDLGSVEAGRRVAQSFADDPDIVAVIGHVDSSISLPAAVMYEYYGILMLSPFSTSPALTRQGFERVFRMVPDDALFGAQLARFAAARRLSRVMIYQAQTAYGSGLANAFERGCEELGIEVPDRLAYDSGSDEGSFARDCAYWKDGFSFDGIFVAGTVPQAAAFVRAARAAGIGATILAGDGLDSPEFPRLAGRAAEGAFVGSVFLPDDPRPRARAFAEAYERERGGPPDVNAAIGYDAVGLLAAAIRKAGSSVPDRIAEALRGAEGWEGVAGSYRFGRDGSLASRGIGVKVVRDGILRSYAK
jgi:branched-chain amino acid transport system substrate-binding protein